MGVGHRWAILPTLVLLASFGGAVQALSAAPPRRGQIPTPTAPAAPSEFDLGIKAFQESRIDDAIRFFSAAAPNMPGNNLVYHYLGASYIRSGQYDTGIAALIRANAFKEDPNTYDWLGLAYRSKGNFPESARCYQKALAMAPENPVLYHGLAIASYWLGWIPESLQAVEMGLQKAANPVEKQRLFEVQSWLYASRGMYPEVYGLAGEKRDFGLIPETHPQGLKIVRLMRGFPADVGGLKPGDVLLSLNGTSLAVPVIDYYQKILPAAAFGSRSTVRFLRAGNEHEAEIIVGIPPNFADLVKSAAATRPVDAAPSLKLARLAVDPPELSPGQRFSLQVDYAASAPAPGSDVQLGFAILEAGKVLHTEQPVSLGPPSGMLQTRLQHLNAARKPGTYTIRVILRCRDLSAEGSVDFTIR